MVGSLGKKLISQTNGIEEKDIVMVSIMPCTAKKFEKERPELSRNGVPNVDYVLTTQELGKMIRKQVLCSRRSLLPLLTCPSVSTLKPGWDSASTMGVAEAVARYAPEPSMKRAGQLYPEAHETYPSWKEIAINEGSLDLKIAIAAGMKDAKN